jgi:hypothetical protein
MFFSDFGIETLRSDFSGRRESLRLFSATPPAMPARAAPPAMSGVFALEASCATVPPAFETAPFDELVAREAVDRVDRLLALGLFRVLDFRVLDLPLDRDVPVDLPFLELELREPLEELLLPFLVLLELERLRVDRLLEDRVVWAIGYRLSCLIGFRASCAFRTGGAE